MNYLDTRVGLITDLKLNGTIVMDYIDNCLENQDFDFKSNCAENIFELKLKCKMMRIIDNGILYNTGSGGMVINLHEQFKNAIFDIVQEFKESGHIIVHDEDKV